MPARGAPCSLCLGSQAAYGNEDEDVLTMQKKPSARYLLTVAACCGLTGSSIGVLTNSVGVFYASVSASLGVGRGAIATHATLAMLTIAALSPLAAKLLYKLPLRLYLGLGLALGVGSTGLMAFAGNIWAFYILGALKGAGVTFFSVIPVTAIISNWFVKNHGLAVGTALSFSGLCGAIFSPLFSFIIETAGWQAAFLCMAGFALLLALPGVLTLRLTPEEAGLTPFGSTGSVTMPAATVEKPTGKRSLYLPALVFTCSFSMLACAITSVGQHFPTVAEAAGLSAQVGAMMVSAGMVGNIASKLAIGILSDHRGPFFANSFMIAVNIAAMAVLLHLPGGMPAVAVAAAFFFGAIYSVGAAGIPLVTRAMFGVGQYTAAYSIVQVFANGGSALALTIIGLVYDLTGSCDPVLAGAIAIQAANLAMLFILSRQRQRKRWIQSAG